MAPHITTSILDSNSRIRLSDRMIPGWTKLDPASDKATLVPLAWAREVGLQASLWLGAWVLFVDGRPVVSDAEWSRISWEIDPGMVAKRAEAGDEEATELADLIFSVGLSRHTGNSWRIVLPKLVRAGGLADGEEQALLARARPLYVELWSLSAYRAHTRQLVDTWGLEN